MATQTKKDQNLDETTERIREFGDRVYESSRKTGLTLLDTQVKAAHSLADYQLKVAESSQWEWAETVGKAQAKFTRGVTDAYATAAREVLTVK